MHTHTHAWTHAQPLEKLLVQGWTGHREYRDFSWQADGRPFFILFLFIDLFISAAPIRQSISLCRPHERERLAQNQTELRRLSEEDCNRARPPGGRRKKSSEELEINMRGWVISKRARHERVFRMMIRAMATQLFGNLRYDNSPGWGERQASQCSTADTVER